MEIDWPALGLVLLIALVASSALVTLVALGITALDHRATARQSGRATAAPTALAATTFLGATAVVGYGLYLVIASA